MGTANGHGLVAVNGLPVEFCGGVEFWSCSGPTDLEKLTEAWATAGLDPRWLPKATTAEKAMSIAVNRQKDGARSHTHRVRVSPMKDVSGWVIVHERAEGDSLSHNTECKVRLTDTGSLIVEPAGHPMAGEIVRDFDKAMGEIDSSSFSIWLVTVIRRMNSVALKQTVGSFYFVPRDFRDSWKKVAETVKAAGSSATFQGIPALPGNEVASAVLDAIAEEARAEAASFAEAIENPSLGSRALRGRAEACGRVLDKVSSYEGLLGGKLDAVRTQIDELKVELINASFTAEAREDAEKAAAK